jgi:hypothetical protein
LPDEYLFDINIGKGKQKPITNQKTTPNETTETDPQPEIKPVCQQQDTFEEVDRIGEIEKEV